MREMLEREKRKELQSLARSSRGLQALSGGGDDVGGGGLFGGGRERPLGAGTLPLGRKPLAGGAAGRANLFAEGGLQGSDANVWGDDGDRPPPRSSGIGDLGSSEAAAADRRRKEKKRLKRGKKLKSIAKKTGKRRRKKNAARTIQRSWRRAKAPERATLTLQRVMRGFVSRRHTERRKKAKEAGVMVAMRGTTQGKSGWYMDFDGQMYFFAVDPNGEWWQVVSRDDWEERQDELDGVLVLVPHEKTKLGQAGKYREFGTEKTSKKYRKWKVLDDGIWKRKKDGFL
jgi:hypothetical protein